MKYRFIQVEKACYPVNLLCRVLEVSRSGYYKWLKHQPSARSHENRQLMKRIRQAFTENRGVYGSPRIHRVLRAQGVQVSRPRVERMMRKDALRAKKRRSFRKTTQSNHNLRRAPNILNREFIRKQCNEVWASDITYLRTHQGWLYLCVILDLYSRRVVGWCVAEHLGEDLAIDALSMALTHRGEAPRLFHSDQGV